MKRLLLLLTLLAGWDASATSALAGHHHFHPHYARPQNFFSVGHRAASGYGYGYRGSQAGYGPSGYATVGYLRVPVVYRAPAVYRAPVAYRYGVGYRGVVSPRSRTGLHGVYGY